MNEIKIPGALRERLLSAQRIGVLTGAGVSAESGIATFRDPDGLWARFKPQELANVRAFLKNPLLVQRWYAERRRVIREAAPNPAHQALADLERLMDNVTVITQNVDGLHQRAGSRDVIELHGSLERNYCMDCGADADPALSGDEAFHCPSCNGLVRPDVVWFGEMLPEHALTRAAEIAETADIFLSVGTSAVVFPAADLPLLAARSGAYTVEINTERSAIAHELDDVLIGPAGLVLPALVGELHRILGPSSDAPGGDGMAPSLKRGGSHE